MKKNINKKIMSMGLVALMISNNTAFADSYKDHEVNMDGVKYLPVRSLMESYGYEVIYNPETKTVELLKGAGYNAYSLNTNSFIRNKMAPMPLQHKIVVKDGKTYVSTKDLGENMNIKELEQDPAYDTVLVTGLSIASIDKDGVIKSMLGEGEAYVYVDKAKVTEYGKTDDYKITDKDIGKELLVTNPSFMIAIYPPQYRAIAVEVLPKGTSATTGTIKEVDLGERKSVLIQKEGYMDVLILINEDTKIENLKGEKIDLKDLKTGSNITSYHSSAMTKSIPGQTNGFKLVVEQ